MKKNISIILTILLVMSFMTGCGLKDENKNKQVDSVITDENKNKQVDSVITDENKNKQVELVTIDKVKDLAVMFTFEAEIVDLIFISPSGSRFFANDGITKHATGDLWVTYRITDAEIGTWKIEYELKGNNQIEYSIIDDDAELLD